MKGRSKLTPVWVQTHPRFFNMDSAWIQKEGMMTEWKEDDKVGFDTVLATGNGEHLRIVIEKDFKCLHPGKNREPELDNYPHPMAQ